MVEAREDDPRMVAITNFDSNGILSSADRQSCLVWCGKLVS